MRINPTFSCYGLLDIVKAVLYLLDHPDFHGDYMDQMLLEWRTRRALAGLSVDGTRFEHNTAGCEWARENGCLPKEEDDDAEPLCEMELSCQMIRQVISSINGPNYFITKL